MGRPRVCAGQSGPAFMVGAALVQTLTTGGHGHLCRRLAGRRPGQGRGGRQASGGHVEVFGAGGEGVVIALEGGSLDAELLCRLPGTQPRVTRQTSPD